MGKVTIFLDKISNLRDADMLGKSDPYVRFVLEQDNFMFDKTFGKQTSSKKKNDLNPEYGETFEFTDVPSVNNLVLHAKVYDDDIGFDDVLGSCKINLEKISSDPTSFAEVIDHKKDGGWFSKKATIYLQVSFTEE